LAEINEELADGDAGQRGGLAYLRVVHCDGHGVVGSFLVDAHDADVADGYDA